MHDEQNQSKRKVHLFFPTEHPIDKLSAFSMKLIACLQILMFGAKFVYYKLVLIATCQIKPSGECSSLTTPTAIFFPRYDLAMVRRG